MFYFFAIAFEGCRNLIVFINENFNTIKNCRRQNKMHFIIFENALIIDDYNCIISK